MLMVTEVADASRDATESGPPDALMVNEPPTPA
jgi:hypothetical protein